MDDRDGVAGGDSAALGDGQLLDGAGVGAVISFSIFMASITQTSAPSSTWAPFSTATFRTVP